MKYKEVGFIKDFFPFLILISMLYENVLSCKPYIDYSKEYKDFENFIDEYKINYRTQKIKEDAFENFIGNKGRIYMRHCIHTTQCPKALPLTSEVGVSKFFDLKWDEFKKYFINLNLEQRRIERNFIKFNQFAKSNFKDFNNSNSNATTTPIKK